jgi:hypothetical protein
MVNNPPHHSQKMQAESDLKTDGKAGAGDTSPENGQGGPYAEQAERARVRRAVVMPILKQKRWKRSKWATEAGVGKNSAYEYLDGKRNLTDENREAMADALGLKPEELPN